MKKSINSKPELLLPAGSLQKAKVALAFGADAVYFGLPQYSLRARINTFTWKSLEQGIKYAHKLGKKAYVTCNIVAHQADIDKLPKDLEKLNKIKPDAVIISDPGILLLAKKHLKNIPLHLSTQANTLNSAAATFWYQLGVSRIILGREASLEDIKKIHQQNPKLELEVFIHGDMCISYSGRCLLSNYLFHRDSNQGGCNQLCRFEYNLSPSDDESKSFKIEEDDKGTYMLNSKTLCLAEELDNLQKAGVISFKVEGRTKSEFYVGFVTKVYRLLLDNKIATETAVKYLSSIPHRGLTKNFITKDPQSDGINYTNRHHNTTQDFCGVVTKCIKEDSNYITHIKIHNFLKIGDEIELIAPGSDKVITKKIKLKKLINQSSKSVKSLHGGSTGDHLVLETPRKYPKYTLVRKR